MDFGDWMNLFGTSQDDPKLKAALAAAGVKRVPKLDDEETSVQFELKGHGLELIMTDEATLKDLDDQDVGEGPMLLSGVIAKFGKSKGRDVYGGKLPYGVTPDQAQAAIRKIFGKPTTMVSDIPPTDIWTSKQKEVIACYAKDALSLTSFGVTLPNVEF